MVRAMMMVVQGVFMYHYNGGDGDGHHHRHHHRHSDHHCHKLGFPHGPVIESCGSNNQDSRVIDV